MKEIDLQIKISNYIEGKMSDSDRREFEIFLSTNSDQGKEVEELKEILSSMKKVEKIKLDSAFDNRLRTSIDNYENKKSNSWNVFKLFENPTYASIGAIAAMFLLIFSTLILRPYGNSNHNHMNNNQLGGDTTIFNIDNVFLKKIKLFKKKIYF